MSLSRATALLRELEVERSSWRARARIDELELALHDAGFVDPTTRERAEKVARRHGATISFPSSNWAPGIGETYLPLFEHGASTVGRLSVRRRDRPGHFGAGLGAVSLAQIRAAYDGLTSSLGRFGAGDPGALDEGYVVRVDHAFAGLSVDGPSLGLPVSIAMLSSYLGRPPRSDVAGTAAVTVSGELSVIGGLREKLSALAREQPQVRTLVIADRQDVPAVSASDTPALVRCSTLEQAWRVFELEFQAPEIPLKSEDVLRKLVAGFPSESVRGYEAEGWRQLSAQARYVSIALSGVDSGESAQALSFAALFALHAGDERLSNDYLNAIPGQFIADLAPAARTWNAVIRATTRIDEDPRGAIRQALEALELARTLRGTERRDLQGRSLGTLGRAYMHAGEFSVAEEWLRCAVDFHKVERPGETSRSMCTLATCQRLAGQASEALRTCEAAIELANQHPNVASSANSKMFLALERARCLLELGRWEEASRELAHLREGQLADYDYPRLSAIRASAEVFRRMDHREECAAMLDRCLGVAENAGIGSMARKVAAYAIGEALLDPQTSNELRARLTNAWNKQHGSSAIEHIRDVLRAAIY